MGSACASASAGQNGSQVYCAQGSLAPRAAITDSSQHHFAHDTARPDPSFRGAAKSGVQHAAEACNDSSASETIIPTMCVSLSLVDGCDHTRMVSLDQIQRTGNTTSACTEVSSSISRSQNMFQTNKIASTTDDEDDDDDFADTANITTISIPEIPLSLVQAERPSCPTTSRAPETLLLFVPMMCEHHRIESPLPASPAARSLQVSTGGLFLGSSATTLSMGDETRSQ